MVYAINLKGLIMRNMGSVIMGGILAFGLGLSLSIQAGPPDPELECSMSKWNGAAPTVPADAVGSPKTTPAVARFSEYCGLAVSATGFVQTPATSDGHYFGRFYVLPKLSGSGTIDLLVAHSTTSGNPELFKVSFDSATSSFIFDADNPEAGGSSDSAPAVNGEWNLIEFEFNSGGDFNVWVNEDWDFGTSMYSGTTIPAFSSGTGSVAFIQLGAPNGMGGFSGGTVFYDAYEAHRTTNVGALIDCDADGSGDPDININDILAVINERFGAPPTLATGQPDCDRDGEVNLNDILETIAVAFPSSP